MAKFQDIEAQSLVVEGQITTGGQIVAVEGHRHTVNDIDDIEKYFLDKLEQSGGLTVNNTLNFNGFDVGHFLQVDSPIYNQLQQTDSIPLEVINPNKDMFIKLNDGILLRKEVVIYLNNKKIVYNKEDDTLKFEDTKYLTGNNTIQLLLDKEDAKYLYFKTNRNTMLLINNSEVMQAVKATEIEYNEEHFNLSKGGTFSSYNFFEESREELPIPFIIGKTLPIKLKYYQKMNIENLEYFMMPKKNIALVFIHKDESINALYTDKESYTYTYDIPENSISISEIECIGANQIKLSDEFKDSLDAVYLFTSTVLEDSPDSNTIGFIPNSEAINDLTPYLRTISLTDSQKEFLNVFKELYFMQSKDIEENNTILNTIMADKLTTVNGIQFHAGDNITITAKANGGNADTIGNLTPNNFLLKEDAIDTDGKIARFNSHGHLVYPDGHEEWIE